MVMTSDSWNLEEEEEEEQKLQQNKRSTLSSLLHYSLII